MKWGRSSSDRLLNVLARDWGYLASERHGHCRGWAGGKHLDCDACRAAEGISSPLQILHTALAGNNKSKFMTERRLTMFLWENHIFIIPFSSHTPQLPVMHLGSNRFFKEVFFYLVLLSLLFTRHTRLQLAGQRQKLRRWRNQNQLRLPRGKNAITTPRVPQRDPRNHLKTPSWASII